MTSPITFTQQSIAELKRVTWPSRAEVINYTLIIIATVTLAGLILGIIDYGLSTGINFIAHVEPSIIQ